MTLGSSLGNFTREEAAVFLAQFKAALGPADLMLVGLDACQDPTRVFRAYNDKETVTEQFYRNGLEHANRLLGQQVFKQEEWEIEGYYDDKQNKHQASYVAVADIDNGGFSFRQGEKIHLEDAFKYSEAECDQLWHTAGLIPQMVYSNHKGDYSKFCRDGTKLRLTIL